MNLLHLYRSSFDVAWAEEAAALQELMRKELWNEAHGGFFLVGPQNRELPVRPKDLHDGAIPSANSVALMNLLGLSRLTGDTRWADDAQGLVRAFAGSVGQRPSACTYFLCGLDFALRPGKDIVIAGEAGSADARRLLAALNRTFAPNQLAQLKSAENAERLARFAGYTDGLQFVQGRTAAHLCVGSACTESVTDVQGMMAAEGFRAYLDSMLAILGESAAQSDKLHLITEIKGFPAELMQNPDHLIRPGAEIYTAWLIERIKELIQ